LVFNRYRIDLGRRLKKVQELNFKVDTGMGQKWESLIEDYLL